MSESQGLLAQQEAFDRIGSELFRLLVEGDERIVCSASSTAPTSLVETFRYRVDGRLEDPDGRGESERTPVAVIVALKALRRACYVPENGTWFGVRITVTPDGRATAEYNYDLEPEWDVPIDPIAYVTDQEKFPRDEDCQPEWLKQKLAEGRARLAERDES